MVAASVLCLWALPALSPTVLGAPDAAPVADEPLALEEWLELLRRRRDDHRAELRRELDALLLELDRVIEDPRSEAARAVGERIVELGDEVAPLLVAHLEPGPEPSPAAVDRADLVADALIQLDATAIDGPLIGLLENGSSRARAHAARVLARASGSKPAGAALLAAFERSTGDLRKTLLTALLTISGPAREQVLDAVLGGDDEGTIAQALAALARQRNVAFRPAVGRILFDAKLAPVHAGALIDYYVACGPEHVEDEELAGLIDLARRASVKIRDRIAILEGLPLLSEKLHYDLRRQLDSMADHTHPEMREAALTALAFYKDSGARRKLLEPYDDRIDLNPEWAERWAQRAAVHYRIGDYKAAVRDWREALRVSRDDPRTPDGVYVGIARAYARMGRLKDAAEALDQAPITTEELRRLADEAVFRELRDHKRYGRVFRLD